MNKVRKATFKDISVIRDLVLSYEERGLLLPVKREQIATFIREYLICEISGEIVGCSALHIYSENLAEIRSLAVKANFSGKGIGRKMAMECLNEANSIGIPKIFALTKAVGFFEKLGFKVVDKEALPEKVYKDCLNCKKFHHCDEVAVLKS